MFSYQNAINNIIHPMPPYLIFFFPFPLHNQTRLKTPPMFFFSPASRERAPHATIHSRHPIPAPPTLRPISHSPFLLHQQRA